jgi:small Trp-rich protein
MPLVIVGVLLLVAHLADFGPFGAWPWWAIGLPFLGAILWWQFADNSGWTQRKVMEKMERKKIARREKAMDALGLTTRRERHATRSREDAARRSTPEATKHDERAKPPAEPARRDPRL